MSDLAIPMNWRSAGPLLVWGVFAFACGFEGVVELFAGHFGLAALGILGSVALTSIAILWAKVAGREAKLVPTHLIIVGLAGCVFSIILLTIGIVWAWRTGFDASSPQSSAPPQELTDLRQQNAALKTELDHTRRNLDVARQSRQDQPLAMSPAPVEHRRLSPEQLRILVREFAKLKPEMPVPMVLAYSNDVRAEANHYMQDFMEAFTRAGVSFETMIQSPTGPEQTGVMLSVPDPQKPPMSAQKLKAALEAAAVHVSYIPLPSNLAKRQMSLFVGPNDF